MRVKDAIDGRLKRTFESDLHQQDGSGGVALRAAVDDELVVLVELLERIRREIGHGSCLRRPQARPLARPAPDVPSTARLNSILILQVRQNPSGPAQCVAPPPTGYGGTVRVGVVRSVSSFSPGAAAWFNDPGSARVGNARIAAAFRLSRPSCNPIPKSDRRSFRK